MERLTEFESALRQSGAYVRRGNDYDQWDLEVGVSLFGSARLIMAVEDHGAGNQFVRLHVWPKSSFVWLFFVCSCTALSAAAALNSAWLVSGIFAIVGMLLAASTIRGRGNAIAAAIRAFEESGAFYDGRKEDI
jgi:hypothetical protein